MNLGSNSTSMQYDAIIPVGPSHTRFAKGVVSSLSQFSQAQTIYILTHPDNFSALASLAESEPKLQLIDETQLIPGVDFSTLKTYLNGRNLENRRSFRPGWYLQQFLKMHFASTDYAGENYLIWDADTLMLQPIDFFDASGRVLMQPADENHTPYFDVIQSIFGHGKLVPHSFVAEHMMIKSEYMRELIRELCGSDSYSADWVWKTMDAIKDENVDLFGFSEFETYGNFLQARHPESFVFREIPSTRIASGKYGLNPSKYDLLSLSEDLSYASFEPFSVGSTLGVLKWKTLALINGMGSKQEKIQKYQQIVDAM